MRLCIIVAAALLLFCGSAWPTETRGVTERTVEIDRDGDGEMDGVDVYDEVGKLVRRGYDDNRDHVMDRWQTYDPNTGLPNVVESDTAGELR
jgi:hypothetical protein